MAAKDARPLQQEALAFVSRLTCSILGLSNMISLPLDALQTEDSVFKDIGFRLHPHKSRVNCGLNVHQANFVLSSLLYQ